jgi:signal peptidase I
VKKEAIQLSSYKIDRDEMDEPRSGVEMVEQADAHIRVEEEEEEIIEKKSLTFRIALTVICVILLGIAFLYKPVLVEGGSMENTLFENDYAYSKRYILSDPARLDIAVIKTEKSQKLSRKTIVKRIIGLPGETIRVKAGIVYVNGSPLDEQYDVGTTAGDLSVTLGNDEYFVIGDNREKSMDSRVFGPVKRRDIVSRVLVVLLPVERFGEVK